MTRLRISVVICAYTEERWHQVLAAVDSIRQQSLGCYEIVVVVDHNRDLFGRLATVLPDATVMENREAPGLSGARNTGVAQARGDVVAFLDDDAVAEPDWLKFFADSYADPAVAGVGGLVLPRWETRRPSWFPKEFDWVVGCSYVGMPDTRAPVRNLMGSAASFRREVFDLLGGFRSGLGRTADARPLGCEETEFCIRLRQRDPTAVLLFDNRAVAWHLVPAARCRPSLFPLQVLRRRAVQGNGDGHCRLQRRTVGRTPVHHEDPAAGDGPRFRRLAAGRPVRPQPDGSNRHRPDRHGSRLHGGVTTGADAPPGSSADQMTRLCAEERTFWMVA